MLAGDDIIAPLPVVIARRNQPKKVKFQFTCYKYVQGNLYDFAPRTVLIKDGKIKFFVFKDVAGKLPLHCLTELKSSDITHVKVFSI